MNTIIKKRAIQAALFGLTAFGLAQVQAAEWSDTAISWRYGNSFAEPFNPQDISKNIFALTHVSGYKYGTNFFNLDLLQSDSKDPGAPGSSAGAQEAYLLYRNTLDIGKIRGQDIKFGPIRGVGLTLGFDWNTKNDVGYNSRKRMLVAGPTLMWDVPGHLNTSIVLLKESNAPSFIDHRYNFKTHPMLTADWGIPLGDKFAFEGYANFIGTKGKDEVGNDTAAETNIDMQLMYDVGSLMGAGKNTFRIGFEYQYWKNKFGNSSATTGNKGQTAKTPMVRAEYHF
ncbi:MAG: outer envelope protein [Pseudomonadota bacterium]